MMDVAGKRYPVLRPATAVFLFSLLFVLLRLHMIFHPQAAGWSLMVDELPTGNIAFNLETGLIMPMPLYQTKPFAAGTLWEGLCSYPLRRVFGPSLFSLKMTAILWNLMAMALWMTLAWKFFSRAASLVVGALYCLSPPFYALMTMTAWGNHCETALPAALCLLCLMSALSKKSDTMRIILAFAGGLTAGFGLYLTYSSFPLCVFAFLLIAAVGGRFVFLNILPPFVAGLVLGVMPLAWSVKYYGFEAVTTIDTYTGYAAAAAVGLKGMFAEADLGMAVKKFASYWSWDIWQACLFSRKTMLMIPGWLCAALVFILSTGLIIWNRRDALRSWPSRIFVKKTKEETPSILQLSIVIFPMLFSIVYSISGFRILSIPDANPSNYANYRYLAAVFPFMFLVVGAAFGDLWKMTEERKHLRGILMVFSAFALIFLSGYYRQIGKKYEPGFEVFLYRGDAPEHLMDRMAAETAKSRDSYGVKVDKINRLDVGDRGLLFEMMSRVSAKGFDKALLLSKDLDKDYRPILYRGLGMGIAKRLTLGGLRKPEELVPRCFDEAPPIPEAFHDHFVEGVGWGMSFALPDSPAVLVGMVSKWNTDHPKWREAMKTGIGRKIGFGLFIDDKMMVPTDHEYEFGLGAQLRRNAEVLCLRYDMASDAILRFEGKRRQAMIEGFIHEGRSFF